MQSVHSNYARLLLSGETSNVASYRSVKFDWVRKFKDRVVNEEEGREVVLYVVDARYEGHDGFVLQPGDTVRLEQENVVEKHLQVSRAWGNVKSGSVPIDSLTKKPREKWTCEDVCEYIIKPAKGPYTAVLENEDGGLVQDSDFEKGTFVSYARQMTFVDFVVALDHYFEGLKEVDRDEIYVWIDLFCASQTKLSESAAEENTLSLTSDQLSKCLLDTISKFERKVLVFDNWKDPAPLKRIWCVWELFGVALANQEIGIAMTPQGEDEYLLALKSAEHFDEVIQALARIDVSRAKCFNPADEKMIKEAIVRHSSYSQVNDVVLGKLREWHLTIARRELAKVDIEPSAERANLLNSVAQLLIDQGELKESEPLLREALEIDQIVYKEVDSNIAFHLNNLSLVMTDQGKNADAEKYMRQALEITERAHGPEHPTVALRLHNLALILETVDNHKEAELLQREALKLDQQLHGDKHPRVAKDMNALAQLLRSQGKLEEAVPLLEQVKAMSETTNGTEHPDFALKLNNLAELLRDQGKLEEAENLYRQALEVDQKVYGEEHPEVVIDLNNLAALLKERHNFEEAEVTIRKALELSEKIHSIQNPEYAINLGMLAELLKVQSKFTEAEEVYRNILDINKKVFGEEHGQVADGLSCLAHVLKAQGKNREARVTYQESLKMNRSVHGDKHPAVAGALHNLAAMTIGQGRFDDAEAMLREALAINQEVFTTPTAKVAVHLNTLAMLLRAKGEEEEAKRLGLEALQIAEEILGPGHPDTKKYERSWGE